MSDQYETGGNKTGSESGSGSGPEPASCGKYASIYNYWQIAIFFVFLAFFISPIESHFMGNPVKDPQNPQDTHKISRFIYSVSQTIAFLIWLYLVFMQENSICNRGYIHMYGFVGFIVASFASNATAAPVKPINTPIPANR
jgi:hypothetical protein